MDVKGKTDTLTSSIPMDQFVVVKSCVSHIWTHAINNPFLMKNSYGAVAVGGRTHCAGGISNVSRMRRDWKGVTQ